MGVLQVVGIVIVVLVVLSFVYTEVQKRLVFAKYERLFSQGDFEGCVAVLDRPLVKFLYPRYNLLYMRLNAQICLDNVQECRRIIDEMLDLNASDEQRLALLVRAFNFFVEQKDYDRAGDLLDELREKAQPDVAAECERTYQIFAKRSSAYIDEMEAALRESKGAERASLLYLLSLQYETRGDRKRAAEYLAQVQEAFGAMAAGAAAGGEAAGGTGAPAPADEGARK